MKRLISLVFVCALMLSALAVTASAADYTFDEGSKAEYYGSTAYEDVYGSGYNYGGVNIVDFYEPTTVTGYTPVIYETPTASKLPEATYDTGVTYPDLWAGVKTVQTAYTDYKSMVRSDGSIGTVNIPSLGVSYKLWEGETTTSMAKGLAHYSSTSAWNGNVGVCGHNRGSKYIIGAIKDMAIGDTITYTTVYGTRTYSVATVATISSTDWSYLNATSDNRITLTTCLAGQPTYRVCVQAVEVLLIMVSLEVLHR